MNRIELLAGDPDKIIPGQSTEIAVTPLTIQEENEARQRAIDESAHDKTE